MDQALGVPWVGHFEEGPAAEAAPVVDGGDPEVLRRGDLGLHGCGYARTGVVLPFGLSATAYLGLTAGGLTYRCAQVLHE